MKSDNSMKINTNKKLSFGGLKFNLRGCFTYYVWGSCPTFMRLYHKLRKKGGAIIVLIHRLKPLLFLHLSLKIKTKAFT